MKQPYQRIKVGQAIAWFRDKLSLPTERWEQIIDSAQQWAFTIAGIESANVLQTIQNKITQILSGESNSVQTFEEFRSTFKEQMTKAGYSKDSPWRSLLVFRNNINSAYNAGRFQQIQESPNEYVQYWHDHPITPRPAHLAIHKMVFRKDDPILQVLNPPNGHGCLCKLLSVSQAELDAEGLQVSTISDRVTLRDRLTGNEFSVPAVRVDGRLQPIVEPGFNYSPGANDSQNREQILEGAIARLSPSLQELVRGRINFSEAIDFGKPCGKSFIPDNHNCTKSLSNNRREQLKQELLNSFQSEVSENDKRFLILRGYGKTYNQILNDKGKQAADAALSKSLQARADRLSKEIVSKEIRDAEHSRIRSGKSKTKKEELAAYERLHSSDYASKSLSEWKSQNKSQAKTLVERYQKELRLDKALQLNNLINSGREATNDFDSDTLQKMTDLRSSLISSGLSVSEANELINSKTIDSSISDFTRTEVSNSASDFYRMTNGAGSDSLKAFTYENSRAFAKKSSGNLNVGDFPSKEVVYHEMGHFVEFSDRRIEKAMSEWRDSRANGELRPLGNGYDDDENALPGNYIDPYVGKVYSNGSTEVLSMGIQYFSSPEAMTSLYQKDKEHFQLILGLLKVIA